MSAALSKAGCAVARSREDSGWLAQLALEFASRNDRTLLTGRRHKGPLLVQRPFYPEGPVCHVYLVHPPGGVVGGDILEIQLDCGSGSEALITTPAAGKFYRTNGKLASQAARMRISDGAALEWLPQETILFDRAWVKSLTRFDLGEKSTLIGWEIVCLGRPACGEGFSQGKAEFSLEIWRGGAPLLLEKMALDAETLRLTCGLKGHTTVGTMFVCPSGPGQLDQARGIGEGLSNFGATLIEDLLICRVLGDQARPVRKLFSSIWAAVRPALNRRMACPPRVWAT